MNTLDDLRTTLDRHASGLPDDALHARTGAVRGRVRVVRRRRRIAAGGTATAVVAAVALGTSLVGPGPAPVADRTLAGHEAPRTMTSLGYTYSFARGVQGDGRATLRLAASDAPRLVSWATEGDDDEVTVRAPEDAPGTVTTKDFGDFVLVPESGGTVRVTGSGRVALAAYDLSRQAPGATDHGITFRDDVAGKRLVGGYFGSPGSSDLSVTLPVKPGPLPLSWLCAHGPKDAWVHVSSGDGEVVSGGGCDDSTFDPAGRGGVELHVGAAEARSVHLRVWVTHGEHGPRVDDPDLRLGVAAYRPAMVLDDLAGTPLHRTEEHGGHLWTLAEARVNQPGARRVTVRGVPGRETLVVMSWTGRDRVVVHTVVDGRRGGDEFVDTAGGAGSTRATIPATGGTLGLEATGRDVPAGLRLGLARYVRVD